MKGEVFNVLSSQLLLQAECGGSAACEVENSVAVPSTSQLSCAQGIREHSPHSSESTEKFTGQ